MKLKLKAKKRRGRPKGAKDKKPRKKYKRRIRKANERNNPELEIIEEEFHQK